MFRFNYLILLSMIFVTTAVTATESDFPNRKIYPHLNYLELNKFQRIYNDVIIVDVRSKYEYDTIHIKDALNISRAKIDFVSKMKELREKNQDKEIVLYCNGRTCEQSYLAGQKCIDNKIQHISVYDGGVFEFASNNPQLTMLVGKPMLTSDKLISKEMFNDHLVSASKFGQMIYHENTITIDIRDRLQREGISLFVGLEKSISLSEHDALEKYIQDANRAKKTILIYDDAGKQVRWLQYYLEDHKIASYFFMQGGAGNYLNNLRAQK